MALEKLAAACIFPSFPGLEAPDWILRRLEGGIGGICLFSYNVRDREQLAELTGVLRAGRDDLLIGIDEEGGDVTRLESGRGSSYPGNGALGVVDDVASTAQVAAAIGADLAAVGVNLDFAPVADINVNPANPVIGIRSFGTDAGLVARHVEAFVTGLQSQGVAACAKHFPGHGSTSQDSHLELPEVLGDVRDGLGPFRAAIAAGVQTIMTAHVSVPELDRLPATLSHAVMTGLLRDELGYDGLVIADALEMKGVSATVGVEKSAVLALAAGVDALLIGHDLLEEWVVAVQAALVDAVVSGELPESRLREAAGRVARVGAWASRSGGDGAIDREAGRAVARRALRADGDLALHEPPLVVELRARANIAAGDAEHSVGSVLQGRLPGSDSVVLDEAAASNLGST
ncbi:MAG TPA: glycoside hydrolase family 3 N-terminal domain-containing protein, partial [Gaiellaceae bacterium]|nr:glycoside hydrolase family 3 N-terminal domain-containing protein [Gaiellaceae bacterium]